MDLEMALDTNGLGDGIDAEMLREGEGMVDLEVRGRGLGDRRISLRNELTSRALPANLCAGETERRVCSWEEGEVGDWVVRETSLPTVSKIQMTFGHVGGDLRYTKQMSNLEVSTSFFFKVLFIYSLETQREREAETEAEGDAGSMQEA